MTQCGTPIIPGEVLIFKEDIIESQPIEPIEVSANFIRAAAILPAYIGSLALVEYNDLSVVPSSIISYFISNNALFAISAILEKRGTMHVNFGSKK